MRKLITISAVVVMLLCTYASADLINFDDISTGSAGYANVPSNYLGLTWSGDWEVISQAYYNAHYPGAVTFPSSPNAAYNGLDFGGNVLSTSSGTAFTLDSLYASRFVGAGPQSSTLTLTAYLGGSLVGSDTLNLSNGFVQWAPALGGLVDKVEFTGDSLANYVYLIDDVTITPVPVPAAVLLGMLGFCVAGLKLRKLA